MIRVFEPPFGQPKLIHQPQEAFRLSGSAAGLEVLPAQIGHINFQDVLALSVYQKMERGQQNIYLMLFSRGRQRPITVEVGKIDYGNFPALEAIPTGMEKFRRLVILLGQGAAGDTLVDKATGVFLKSGQVVQIQNLPHEPVVHSTAFATRLGGALSAPATPAKAQVVTVPRTAPPQAAAAPQVSAPPIPRPASPAPSASTVRPVQSPSPPSTKPAAAPHALFTETSAPPSPGPSPRPTPRGAAAARPPAISPSSAAARSFGLLFFLVIDVLCCFPMSWIKTTRSPVRGFSGLSLGGFAWGAAIAAIAIFAILLATKRERMSSRKLPIALLALAGLGCTLSAGSSTFNKLAQYNAVVPGIRDVFEMTAAWYLTLAGFAFAAVAAFFLDDM